MGCVFILQHGQPGLHQPRSSDIAVCWPRLFQRFIQPRGDYVTRRVLQRFNVRQFEVGRCRRNLHQLRDVPR